MGLFSRSNDPRSGREDIPPPPTGGLVGWLKKQVGLQLNPGEEAEKEKVASGTWQKDFPLFLPYIDDKTNETPTMRKQYRIMWSDPNVKAACAGKIITVAALDTRCLPADEDDPECVEHAEFLEWTINECLEGGMHGLVWSLLTGGCTDGYAILEKVTEMEETGEWAGKLVLSALKPKVVDDNIIIEQDPFGNPTSIKGLKWNAGLHFDPRHFLIYRHFPLYGSPVGMSDFRAAYARFWMLDTVIKLRAWGIEKRAIPLLLGTYEQPHLKATLDTAMRNCKSSHWLSAPVGCKVEAINIASSGDEIFKSAILDLKHDIFLAIKFASLQNVEGDSGDRRGNAEVSQDESQLLPWYYAKEIETLFNSRKYGLIRNDIIGPNFYTDRFPTLKMGTVDVAVEKAEMEMWESGAGLTKLSKARFFASFPTLAPPIDEDDEMGGEPDPMPGMPGGPGMPGMPGGDPGQEWAKDSGQDAPAPGDEPEEKFFESFAEDKGVDEKPWHATPQSSWVRAFRYSAKDFKLHVEFKDFAICEYSEIDPNLAHNFRRVKSKGKFVWRELYHLPYDLIRDAERHGGVKIARKPKKFREWERFAEDDWQSVTGERGGHKWVNSKSGHVVYGKDRPGQKSRRRERKDLEQQRTEARLDQQKQKAAKPPEQPGQPGAPAAASPSAGSDQLAALAQTLPPEKRGLWPKVKKMATGAAIAVAAKVTHAYLSGELAQRVVDNAFVIMSASVNGMPQALINASGMLDTTILFDVARYALSHGVMAANNVKQAAGFAEGEDENAATVEIVKTLWKALELDAIPMPTPEQIEAMIARHRPTEKPKGGLPKEQVAENAAELVKAGHTPDQAKDMAEGHAKEFVGKFAEFTSFDAKDWSKMAPGPRGGTIWKNSKTGKIKYGADNPGGEGRDSKPDDKPASTRPAAYEMYSPNVAEGMTFAQAHQALHSSNQGHLRAIADDIGAQLGMHGKTKDAIGDWADGAENSIVQEIHGSVSADTIRYHAAQIGKLANQKAVATFVADSSGPDSFYTMTVAGKNPNEVRESLGKHGINFRTIVPTKGGYNVMVMDMGRQLAPNLEAFADEHGITVEESRGHAEFVGDKPTRADATREYDRIIGDYEKEPNRPRFQPPGGSHPGGGAASGSADKFAEQVRCPAGYTQEKPLVIGGKSYIGGEFIPGDVVESATPEEKHRIEHGPEAPPHPESTPNPPPPEPHVWTDADIDEDNITSRPAQDQYIQSYTVWESGRRGELSSSQYDVEVQHADYSAGDHPDAAAAPTEVYRWATRFEGDDDAYETGDWTFNQREAIHDGRRHAENSDTNVMDVWDGSINEENIEEGRHYPVGDVEYQDVHGTASVQRGRYDVSGDSDRIDIYRAVIEADDGTTLEAGEWTQDRNDAQETADNWLEDHGVPSQTQAEAMQKTIPAITPEIIQQLGGGGVLSDNVTVEKERLHIVTPEGSDEYAEGWSFSNKYYGVGSTQVTIGLHDGHLEAYYNGIFMDNPKESLAAPKIMAAQFKAMRDIGVQKIHCQAAGSSAYTDKGDMIGYKVWPKVGFDGKIDTMYTDRLPDKFKEAKTIQELYAMPGGQKAWEQHGGSSKMTLDMAGPGGERALRILEMHCKHAKRMEKQRATA